MNSLVTVQCSIQEIIRIFAHFRWWRIKTHTEAHTCSVSQNVGQQWRPSRRQPLSWV